jgi:hypothetical protein
MKNLGVIEKRKISDRDIHTAFALFKNHNIVDKIEGTWTDPNTRIIIYPSILFVISSEKINEIYEITQQDEMDQQYEEIREVALTAEESE